MNAEEFFIQEWGTGFTRATLHEKNGLLELSMEDIYSTMEKYKNQLPCDRCDGKSEWKVLCVYCEADLSDT